MITQALTPLGFLMGGMLADYIFEPFMKKMSLHQNMITFLVGRQSGSRNRLNICYCRSNRNCHINDYEVQSCHQTVGSIVDMTVIHSLQMQQNNILTTGFPEGYFVKEISLMQCCSLLVL